MSRAGQRRKAVLGELSKEMGLCGVGGGIGECWRGPPGKPACDLPIGKQTQLPVCQQLPSQDSYLELSLSHELTHEAA